MDWKYELYIVLFIAFGALEFLTNTFYLIKRDGLRLAARQHFELPAGASRKQLKTKVIGMLIFGGLFLSAGIIRLICPMLPQTVTLALLTVYTLYTFIEALYYRSYGAYFMTSISAILLLVFLY